MPKFFESILYIISFVWVSISWIIAKKYVVLVLLLDNLWSLLNAGSSSRKKHHTLIAPISAHCETRHLDDFNNSTFSSSLGKECFDLAMFQATLLGGVSPSFGPELKTLPRHYLFCRCANTFVERRHDCFTNWITGGRAYPDSVLVQSTS